MTSNTARSFIAIQAEALGPHLYAGVASCLTASRKRARGLDHDTYPHLLPLLLRADLREHLASETLPNEWSVGGNSRLMGQLLLVNKALDLELRFLKERRATYPGGIPCAGANRARRRAWANQRFLPFPDLEVPGPEDARRFLLCWDFAPESESSFTLRVVHTVGAGTYGSAVPVDLSLEVRAGGTIFDHLAFEGAVDAVDFFGHVDIAEGENGS